MIHFVTAVAWLLSSCVVSAGSSGIILSKNSSINRDGNQLTSQSTSPFDSLFGAPILFPNLTANNEGVYTMQSFSTFQGIADIFASLGLKTPPPFPAITTKPTPVVTPNSPIAPQKNVPLPTPAPVQTPAPTKRPRRKRTRVPVSVNSNSSTTTQKPTRGSNSTTSANTTNANSTNSSFPLLAEVGDNYKPLSAFPLQECEGDCDNDLECDFGLICMIRVADEPVPNCGGSGKFNWDYCYRPGPDQLVYMANYGEPVENYPLQACQGDCDADFDCDLGLVCMHRDDLEEVPGCVGEGRSGIDYCYKPVEGTLVLYGAAGAPAKNYPLQLCQGDCRQDNECADGLRCMMRTATEAVPGCYGDGEATFGYCYDPADIGKNMTVSTANISSSSP
jgi:hypothetical protein